TLKGEPLAPFEPQKRYLYVLNLGDGTGFGVRGGFSWRGRSAMKLKHLIDQRFMREYGN
nr:pyridine nucleotide-disulfide oxidoreductase [Rubrobacter sp.]